MSRQLRTDPSGFATRWSGDDAAAYRAAGHWRDETLGDVARRACRQAPDRLLLSERDQCLTRAEAWAQALRLVAFFLSRRLEPGDVVSFQLPNWLEAAVIALAARLCGLVLNPIPPIYRVAEVGYILKDCGAKLVFVPQVFRKHDHRRMLDGLRTQLPDLEDVVVVRGDGAAGLTWREVTSLGPAPDEQLPAVDPAAAMLVMYTSGTTGRPKGVLHSHQAFDYRVRTMGEAWSIAPSDVVLMPSPVTHITGAFWAFDMPWVRGCASVLMDVWTADDGIRCIEANRCTVSGGATPFLRQLLDTAAHRPEAMASLRLFFCGGTTVSPDLIREAAAAYPHCLFFRAYGSTEMPTTTLGIRDRAQAELGAETDGEVVPPTEVRIVDASGVDLPDGAEGEILVRGPEQFVGYLHAEDNVDAFDEDGYFRMGDLGRRVHGRYLVITGRKKDIIIRAGENISPKEVEDVLLMHAAVADVAIVAMPSPETGEQACAFVVLEPGHTIDLAAIRRFLERAGLARQKFPEHLVTVDDLPRVPSGKVRKDVLRARAEEIAGASAQAGSRSGYACASVRRVPATIPVEVADITAAWLDDVLRAHAPGASVRAIEVVEAHSGTTGRARVVLTDADPELPRSVFVKLAPFDVSQRAFVDQQGMGIAEARFYAEIAADVPVRHPRSWYAARDDAGRYVMVLEDLHAAGARYPGQADADLPEFVMRTIEAFGALHAAFWASPRFAPDADLKWVERRSRGYGSAAPFISFAVEQLGARLPDASRRLAEVYVPRADGVAELLARGTPTLVHGDAHLGNMFVDGTTPGFLDWAMVSCAPGLRDVAYFLGASVPTELRRAHERQYIARYCERLRAGGVALDVDAAWEQYRVQLVTAWIAAVATAAMGSKWQPIEVGMGATLRADASIADHGVADLLCARLP